jgi:hypothetical protein
VRNWQGGTLNDGRATARQQIANVVEARQNATEVSYPGGDGVVVCHLLPKETDKVIVLSLIYVRLHRSPPFAAAVFDYQKRRVKKLKKQMGGQFD